MKNKSYRKLQYLLKKLTNYISYNKIGKNTICTKEAQKYATNIEHLEKGIIVNKLTSVKKHPRGIKVRIYPIKEGRYPTEEEIAKVLRYYEKNKDEIESEMTPMILKFRKGRVTYVVDKNNNLIKG